MERNYNLTWRAAYMLRMFWRTLERVPFVCMVRTDSPSHRVMVTDSTWYRAMPLWGNGQTIIFHNTGDGLCAII